MAAEHGSTRRSVDVAVVGAGFAGLTAAVELRGHGKSVAVLEARNRVGGRAHNHHIGGGEISEAGATFVGPTQGHIIRLAERFKVGRFPTYDTGDNVYYRDGIRLTYSDRSPTGIVPPDPTIAADAAEVVTLLDQLSTEVPVDAPWQASRADEWDGQTLESWAETHSSYSVNESFRRLVAVATRPIFGAEPREISFLFTLFYIAASGDEQHAGTFERNFSTRAGAQMWRFYGGTATITCLPWNVARSVCTLTPWRPWTMRRTGDPSSTRGPSWSAIRSAIFWDPPTNRHICAPPRVSKLRSNVPGCFSSPDAAM